VATVDPTSALHAPDPLRIVAIGGGTGLSTLLQGVKAFVRKHGRDFLDITAVVTVTDDGGSSGRLRREFDILPPGDIRNCMVALAEDEHLLAKLFQYRFESGKGLRGHSFGNLFLAALTHVTGDFPKAIALSSEILAIDGKIYPSTADNVTIQAKLADGTRVRGETNISRSVADVDRVEIRPKHCRPLPETLDAIQAADLICLGPGSLYTSVVPNLLVHGIPEAIANSRALKVYFCNIMSQPGETTGYTASQHVEAILRHAGQPLLDCVVVNVTRVPAAAKRAYAELNQHPVPNDLKALEKLGLRVIRAELLATGAKARHEPSAIAQVAMELAMMSRADRRILARL
jgi:uncharacterized cofD-like protein